MIWIPVNHQHVTKTFPVLMFLIERPHNHLYRLATDWSAEREIKQEIIKKALEKGKDKFVNQPILA